MKNKIIRSSSKMDKSYSKWIADLKQRFRHAQIQTAIRVNSGMLEFYWSLAQDLVKQKAEEKWGAGVVNQISLDLKAEFPEAKGFSTTNLWNMKKWYLFYAEKLQQVVGVLEMPKNFALIPWGQHIAIFTKSETVDEALFYINKTIENNWSRAVLVHQMETGLYQSLGKSVNNFGLTIPETERLDVSEILKESYTFDFIPAEQKLKERNLESGLEQNIMRFLLELGKGFAFVGRQVELVVEGDSFFIDMLFYHIRLKRYVVVELKVEEFSPSFIGQLGFYVTASDHLLKQKDDNPTIGLLICKSKKKTVVEWSLANMVSPIGVAEYKLLPKAEDLQKQIDEL